jgi:GNAT superfamily N-acetyltransferase
VSVLRVEPLGPGNVEAWLALFERAASPCFCRFWHFTGTKNEWLARCATGDENVDEARASATAGNDDASGLVALDGDRAVGWLKVAPRRSLPKLRGLPIYRGLDLGPDEGVFSVGCFLVDPASRRRGVAGALLDAVPDFVRARGGSAVEAFPRHVHETHGARLHDEEAMMGPEALFVSRGYARLEVVPDFALTQYPVYRLSLCDDRDR